MLGRLLLSPATALAGVSLVAAGMLTSPATAAAAGVELYTAEVTVTKVVVSPGPTGSAVVRLVVVVTPVSVVRPAVRPDHRDARTAATG
ncbi:hypothetical protein [Amycolatopsis eburnea]|uniref:Uncharacterized protein n=1 Tax=Amycolatopsis eburnea TaxID=2267691 RepID=A0A427T2I5_9PSEU|nr:hypothetical protein [Amycolatopsis eburnea]RSD11933.1 hypothetical protein EIY87_34920 [Amycolatopsis eburnea]